jgi:hypothetical protein
MDTNRLKDKFTDPDSKRDKLLATIASCATMFFLIILAMHIKGAL